MKLFALTALLLGFTADYAWAKTFSCVYSVTNTTSQVEAPYNTINFANVPAQANGYKIVSLADQTSAATNYALVQATAPTTGEFMVLAKLDSQGDLDSYQVLLDNPNLLDGAVMLMDIKQNLSIHVACSSAAPQLQPEPPQNPTPPSQEPRNE